MSTQRALTDYTEPVDKQPPISIQDSDTKVSNHRSCNRCGSHVPPAFRRTHGTNDGELFACLNCAHIEDLRQGAGSNPEYDFEGNANGNFHRSEIAREQHNERHIGVIVK